MIELTSDQLESLSEFGFPAESHDRFRAGVEIPFDFVTESSTGIALLQLAANRLRCGILTINDPGGGLQTFVRFRVRAFQLGRAFGLSEVELYGMEVFNDRLLEMLLRQGFEQRLVPSPEDLGTGENVMIVAKVFEIK